MSTKPEASTVSLDDKYALSEGRAFMSGVQALVRLPMLQQARDAAQGKNTAGFISGYRGSPLGTYDLALWQAEQYLRAHHIVFKPGVNEELAAMAVSGTQQLGYAPPGTHKFDGVFGLWYGKGPGADRCGDVFKHANMAGTTALGGVIAVVGDDHAARSSSLAHQTDHLFKACGFPVFFPASVQEILDMGLHAWALSRYAGVWASLKTIQEVVESSATVLIDPQRVAIQYPTDFVIPPEGGAYFTQQIAQQFEGPYRVHYHLAPPALGARKRKFGPWMRWVFALLAPLKVLRGTCWDVFGYSVERKMERALIAQYRSLIEGLLPELRPDNYDQALEIAGVPEMIKGYGHIKHKSIEAAQARWRK